MRLLTGGLGRTPAELQVSSHCLVNEKHAEIIAILVGLDRMQWKAGNIQSLRRWATPQDHDRIARSHF
jgi:N-acetyl-anhydromuramyl-L-alanine amidase AmpD